MMLLRRERQRTLLSSNKPGRSSMLDHTSFWGLTSITLVVGMLMGGLCTYLLLLPPDDRSAMTPRLLETASGSSSLSIHANDNNNRINGNAHSALRQPEPPHSSSSSSSQGWHPIHVFYGKEEGLQADPTQEWFAQVHQDEIVMDVIGPNGFFIDLAANDAKEWSNTIALEKHGWNGLCIEPNPAYWYGLSHRKCTVIGALVGGPTVEKVTVKFRGVFGGILGRMDEKLANRKREPDAAKEERYTVPFTELLQMYNVPATIDYLSLDVEGAEYLIMQHFPFDKYTIRLLTIERPSANLKKLLEEHGYIKLKALAWWGETLWAHESTGLTPAHPKIAKIQTEERN